MKTAQQRAKDFEDLEKNGLIARNDLLKVQLQQSKVQLSLDEMKKKCFNTKLLSNNFNETSRRL